MKDSGKEAPSTSKALTPTRQKVCHLCDVGFPIRGANHIPTQSLGMIPVLRCSKLITRADIAFFRQFLNKKQRDTKLWRNGRLRQLTRPYGDYLYAQDREKFMADLRAWLPTLESSSVVNGGKL